MLSELKKGKAHADVVLDVSDKNFRIVRSRLPSDRVGNKQERGEMIGRAGGTQTERKGWVRYGREGLSEEAMTQRRSGEQARKINKRGRFKMQELRG
jgi:hypothetical protein